MIWGWGPLAPGSERVGESEGGVTWVERAEGECRSPLGARARCLRAEAVPS